MNCWAGLTVVADLGIRGTRQLVTTFRTWTGRETPTRPEKWLFFYPARREPIR